jgi:hypothetical protein
MARTFGTLSERNFPCPNRFLIESRSEAGFVYALYASSACEEFRHLYSSLRWKRAPGHLIVLEGVL